jgi:hypothetical protein
VPATSDPASPQEEGKPAEVEAKKENETGEKIRASKLEFKMVNETYISPELEQSACAS